ncbi:15-hydroxyprostaglandin dehydrogenase [NAD(+)]-like isoform X1 [Mytilus galloprovincialis]|uniref:15-hydroxyprostaglandin dehydrogenase [NAD(+)]-like isoform X1 n=1 Tax=Mytilus galloprovincialis TaxID=29158 RepID=UPI003F7BF347
MRSLEGKVAVISGGASGIGLAFVETFLQRKSKVSFCDINDEGGKETLQNLQNKYGESKVMFQKCNVTSQDEMAAFFRSTKEKFGRLDVVINNAGIGGETTSWERTVDVNLKGMISGTFLGLEYLKTDKGGNGGVIVNVSSAAGLRANPLSPVYCASKSGVVAFSQSLACNEDVINGGVRINTICPAFADTALVRDLYKDNSVNGNRVTEFVNKIGIMTTQEVAEGLLELVTDERKNGAILKMSKLYGKEYVTMEYKTVNSIF